jgi:phosphatidylserine/phosphatidylglycerophosphate/cardiolipin synthase-like enzyme
VAQQSLGIDLGLGGTGEGDSGETTGGEETPGGAGETTGGGEEVSGSGDYYTVYFTDPVIPFDDVTTGGIEKNLIALIDGAQTSIVGATFEFNLQNVADALIAAHNRGVQVRMVYDNEHTEEDPQMAQMIAAGIPATPDERSAFMHNKFFVIDGQVVWLGSWNVSINDSYRNNNNAIVIRSTKLAENYSTEFEEMFAGEFGPTSPENTPNPSFTLNGIRIESYFASEDPVEDRLVEMVRAAQQSVHFMAFSFTDDGLAQAMLDRAAAGVEVLGIFEQRGSDTESSSCGPLRGAELDVRIDSNPRTFHHKVVIVDGAVVSIGSFNFSANAAESNDENLIIVHDPNVAALYEQEFNKWFAQSQQPPGSTCDLP